MYCTLDDIRGHIPESRLVELTDDLNPNDEGSVVQTVVDKAIAESSALIDIHVAKRYTLPLEIVPSVLVQIAVNLSIYNLYERVTEMDITDGMMQRYNNAMSLLKQIASGALPLGIDEPESPVQGFQVSSVVSGGPQIFTLDSMVGL